MNTLKIRKGEDIKLAVDDTQLFFVTGFSAVQRSDEYDIKEYLCDTPVESIMRNKKYNITITAYSHLDRSVFEKESFSIFVDDNENVVEYCGCKLKEVCTDVFASKPVINRFVITACDMRALKEDV